MEKHTLYFRILESFRSTECPACHYLTKSIEKYFDDLLYEGVSDSGFIQKFRKNKGFCNYHSYKLLSYKNTLGIASIYSYLFMDIIDEMKSINLHHPKLKNRKECPVCDFETTIERMYFSAFREYLNEVEFKEAFLKSQGLCYPHYLNLLKNYIKRDLPEWLNTFQISMFKKTYSKIRTYLDFRNFSLGDKKPDLSQVEQLIYKTAVKKFAGYEGMKY